MDTGIKNIAVLCPACNHLLFKGERKEINLTADLHTEPVESTDNKLRSKKINGDTCVLISCDSINYIVCISKLNESIFSKKTRISLMLVHMRAASEGK